MKNFVKLNKYLRYSVNLLIVTLLVSAFILLSFGLNNNKSYSLFVEFNDAYGLKIGTSVNYKGVKIGYISKINIHSNRVIVLINIKGLDVLLPKDSVFEANQIGLFNDRVINITPPQNFHLYDSEKYSNSYLSHQYYIKPNSYVKGYKGINYDDLIRATTRIAQRFDDPRFFSLFYLLLQNTIEISDDLVFSSKILSNFCIYVLYAIRISILEFCS